MSAILSTIRDELEAIRQQSLWKSEREILSSQSAHIEVAGGREVLNFCANNYLGLANHPALANFAAPARSLYEQEFLRLLPPMPPVPLEAEKVYDIDYDRRTLKKGE